MNYLPKKVQNYIYLCRKGKSHIKKKYGTRLKKISRNPCTIFTFFAPCDELLFWYLKLAVTQMSWISSSYVKTYIHKIIIHELRVYFCVVSGLPSCQALTKMLEFHQLVLFRFLKNFFFNVILPHRSIEGLEFVVKLKFWDI